MQMPYYIFPAAQLVEHDHLGSVGILVPALVDQVFVRLKVIEKDHRDAGCVCIDDLACEGVPSPTGDRGGADHSYTYHVLCTKR